MTQPQPEGTPELVDEQLTPVEAAFYTLVLAAIVDWLAAVRPRVMAPVAAGALPAAMAIFAFTPPWIASVKRLISWLRSNAVPVGTERLRAELPGLKIPTLPSTHSFIQSHLAQVENYLVRIPDEVYQLVFAEISEGVNQGEDLRQIADRVDKILTKTGSENWPARAKVIAITEVNGAANAGWYASAANAERELGVRLEKVWLAAHDAKVRPSHRAANGQRRGLIEPFIVGGFPLLYPGDKNGPPEEVINCVPGGSLVHVPGLVRAYRFEWNGPVFTLRGKGGLRCTVSPYHPVLTEHGWLPACEIQKGDYVLRTIGSLAWSEPDIKSFPAPAEEIYNSLALSNTSQRVEPLGVDFHGDRPNGQVDVVLADWHLRVNRNPEFQKLVQEFLFALADSPNASPSPLFHLGDSASFSPSGIVGRLDLLGALVREHLRPLEEFGFRTSTDFDSFSLEAVTDQLPGDAEKLREAFNRFAAQVSFDQIVHIDIAPYHGYLYSFQTDSGIYIADDMVTHNCRCAAGTKGARNG